MAKGAKARAAARKQRDKWKAKRWYTIRAPRNPWSFRVIGETLAEEPEQLINYYYSNEQQLNQVQSLVLEEQIVALVLASAQVIDEPVSYDEAIKPPAPESSDEDDANQTSDADADLASEPDQSAETDDEAPAAELSPEAVNKAETKD